MIRLGVRVARERGELVLAELLVLSPAGLEERDVDPGTVEFALYGTPEALPGDAALRAAAGAALVGLTREEVAEDWGERWKAWHRPVEVAGPRGRLRVRPPWEPALAPDPASTGTPTALAPSAREPIELVIDPGQAFGTGAHPTTRLCLELLLGLEPAGALADWGTGTGVLALAAARLGFGPVSACDHERPAVEAAEANARANGIAGIAVTRLDLLADPLPWAPTVTANLVRPLLLAVADRLVRPPERLIASGLLREEADEVAGAFARHGLLERDRRALGEWAALLLGADGPAGGAAPTVAARGGAVPERAAAGGAESPVAPLPSTTSPGRG